MKQFLVLVLLFICQNGNTQTRASQCYFGTCLIDFSTNPFIILSTNAVACHESPASICGEDGQLLFYSNGGPSPTASYIGGVWSANGSFMENGQIMDSAGCMSTYQGACIIPKPSLNKVESSEYYLFTNDCLESSVSSSSNFGLTLAVIDMSANNGLGTVVSKYQSIVPYQIITNHTTNNEPLSIIGHANGLDYWLFSYTKDSLYRLPITTTGIGTPTLLFPSGGRILFSPSKNNAIIGHKYYSFDAQTGDLNFITDFTSSTRQYAFSSDGTKLYTLLGGTLTQYDCLASNLMASQIIVATSINSATYQLFLADNSYIYLAGSVKTYIDAKIVCPNNSGVSCGFDPADMSLFGGFTGTNNFTNIPAHWLYKAATNCNLGVEDETTNQLFSIVQSPNQLTVSSSISEKCTVQLVHSSGALVFKTDFIETTVIDQEGLAKGIYFAVFETLSGVQVTKKIGVY